MIAASDIPLAGTTLIVGPTGVGKTKLTAELFERWVDLHGAERVVILEFGPDISVDGQSVGAPLERFVTIPEGVWVGEVDAHAPRLTGRDEHHTRALASENAERATALFEDLPPAPRAVFVNDVTLAFHDERSDPERLMDYLDTAEYAVINGHRGESLGTDDDISHREREVIDWFSRWASRTVTLP